jgi:hypothetical protein
MDCKSQPMPYMARTMLRILIEELSAIGLSPATIAPAPPETDEN